MTLMGGLSYINGQTFNGKAIMWNMNDSKDSRISVKFGTSGINIGGYEGTSLMVKNNVNKKIYVKVRFIITDHCGKETIRNVEESITPNGTLGGSTFMGASEQLDYGTNCKERTKYDENYSTKIKSVRFIYAKVREEGETFDPSDDNQSGTSQNNGTGNNDNGSSNTQGSNTNTNTLNCPTQALSIFEGPFIDCISLRWLTENVNYANTQTNDFKQTNIPTEYYLSWRKEGTTTWKELFFNSQMMKYNLTGLDPCTSYEIRIQRSCGNGIRSDYSNIIPFKTACPAPLNINATDIKKDMATIESARQMFINYCSPKPISFVRVAEFKTDNTDWEKVFCVSGSPCKLFNLKPSTTYRVRMRFKYSTGSYSEYSNEISFKTMQ